MDSKTVRFSWLPPSTVTESRLQSGRMCVCVGGGARQLGNNVTRESAGQTEGQTDTPSLALFQGSLPQILRSVLTFLRLGVGAGLIFQVLD